MDDSKVRYNENTIARRRGGGHLHNLGLPICSKSNQTVVRGVTTYVFKKDVPLLVATEDALELLGLPDFYQDPGFPYGSWLVEAVPIAPPRVCGTTSNVLRKRDLISRNIQRSVAKHRQGRVVWAVASLGVSGGIKVIWNCAQAMRDAGWETHLLVAGGATITDGVLPAEWQDFLLLNPHTAMTAAPFDIAIGTFWSTWEHVARLPARRRIGFVQSDEPEWYENTAKRLQASLAFTLPGFEHIVIAEWMREFEVKYNHNIIGVAQNGVDGLVYSPRWYTKREWPKRMMAVRKGSKTWFDGQEHADRVAELVAKRHPDLEYIVVGGGRVPPQNVGCKVETVDTYDPAWMCAVYNGVSVYVLPSRIEGSSLTVLEAMACGTPVVCTPIASDAIIDRQNALVVPYGDSDAMAAAVLELFADEALCWCLYYEGLKTARERTLERQRIQFMEAIAI